MLEYFISFLNSFWMLTAEMSPWLLGGFLAAGVLHAWVPVAFVTRHIGGESPASVLKASLLGIPLPLCSCGVLPLAASLRKAGSGKAPTLAFLITTPVTGVDSLAATWSLMGWFFMLARLTVSFLLGIATGLILSLVGRGRSEQNAASSAPPCALREDGDQRQIPSLGFAERLKTALRYAFLELPETLASSVLTGLLLGGLIAALLPPEIIGKYIGTGFGGILAATAIGIPLYVCATGSIPIAAALLIKGFSPGAALAFMVAGPATNMVALSAVSKLLGKRELLVYLSVIFSGAFASGLALDWFFPQARDWLPNFAHEHHAHGLSLFDHIAAVLFLLLTLLMYVRGRFFISSHHKSEGSNAMKTIRLSVPGMTCNHCRQSVTRALSALEGVNDVEVNLNTKEVSLSHEGLSDEEILLRTLESIGFEAEFIEKD